MRERCGGREMFNNATYFTILEFVCCASFQANRFENHHHWPTPSPYAKPPRLPRAEVSLRVCLMCPVKRLTLLACVHMPSGNPTAVLRTRPTASLPATPGSRPKSSGVLPPGPALPSCWLHLTGPATPRRASTPALTVPFRCPPVLDQAPL